MTVSEQHILKCPIKDCDWVTVVTDTPETPLIEYFAISNDFIRHLEREHTHAEIMIAMYSWAIHYSFKEESK